jgi:hypothetical protein
MDKRKVLPDNDLAAAGVNGCPRRARDNLL